MQSRILPFDAWWWQVGGPLEFPSGCWLIAKKRGHRSVIHVPRYMFLCPGRSCLQARGHINMVEVVVDTVLEGVWAPGLVSEVLLRGEASSTLLIAADAYSRDEWHLFSDSIVVLDGLASADSLEWYPARIPWRSRMLG